MYSMRKIVIALLITVMLFSNLPVALAGGLTQSKGAVLMDVASGRVLYASNPDARCYPASTTKIVTAVVALQNGELTDIVTTSQKAATQEGSSIYLARGERLTFEEMLYGLLLASGNDSAVAIAEHIAGSTARFAAMMNKQAVTLGATHSHFTNPNGLPDAEHYTTPYDLTLIARCGLWNIPEFRKIVSTKKKLIPDKSHKWDRELINHNELLWSYAGADGVKTGYTQAAGHCLVASATRDGHQLVATTLCSANAYADVKAMLDYGFNNYKFVAVGQQGQLVKTLPVKNGTADTVGVVVSRDLCMPILPGEENEIDTKVILPKKLTAPVVKGQHVGELVMSFNGKEMTRVALLANGNVQRKTLRKTLIAGMLGDMWSLINKMIGNL